MVLQPRHFHQPHFLQLIHGHVRSGRLYTLARNRPRLRCQTRLGVAASCWCRTQPGQLSEYVDRGANGDFLRIFFDPPLPACGHGTKLQSSSFSVSIRAAADLIKGTVESRCGDQGQVLDWHPSQPIWASR